MTGKQPASAPANAEMGTAARDDMSMAFEKGLIARGEAVRLALGQALPAGATHEIIQETGGDVPSIRRRRFALIG